MTNTISIISVNISEKKGTIKVPVSEIELNEFGVANDAHSGKWHRQVSLLADESFDRFTGLYKTNKGFFSKMNSVKS